MVSDQLVGCISKFRTRVKISTTEQNYRNYFDLYLYNSDDESENIFTWFDVEFCDYLCNNMKMFYCPWTKVYLNTIIINMEKNVFVIKIWTFGLC